jgi:hypothetical protein
MAQAPRSALMAHQPTLHLHVLGTFPGSVGALFLGVRATADQCGTRVPQAFGLPYGYEPIMATVSAAGIKDTVTGSITVLTA